MAHKKPLGQAEPTSSPTEQRSGSQVRRANASDPYESERRAAAYFDSEFNPTEAELEAWAYSGEGRPHEDFDLFVIDLSPAFLARMTAEPNCLERDFFLRCL